MRTRLAAPLAAVAAALLVVPSLASADACLPAKGSVDATGVRGVHVGVQADIRDADGNPLNVKKVSYCVEDGGTFSLALSHEQDVVLALSTSLGDSIGPINPTSPDLSARAEFPTMKRIYKTPESSVYRVDGRRQLILGVANGRVTYIGAADRLLLEYPAKLGYYLKRLGF